MFGDTRDHLRTNLVSIMKGEDEIRPPVTAESAIGAGLALDLPTNAKQCREDPAGLGRRPLAHAAGTEIEMDCGRLSPCPSRSAMTRSASTCAFAVASSRVVPYASTPDSCGTSANHRPSSSRSHSISKFMSPRNRCSNCTRVNESTSSCRQSLARAPSSHLPRTYLSLDFASRLALGRRADHVQLVD